MDLAAAIKEARLEQNRSQKDLAEAVGCSRTTIAHYEQGRRAPRPDLLEKIAEELSLDLAALVPDHGDTSEDEEEPTVETSVDEEDEVAAEDEKDEKDEVEAEDQGDEGDEEDEEDEVEAEDEEDEEDAAPTNGKETPEQQAAREAAEARQAEKRKQAAEDRARRARRAASSAGARKEAPKSAVTGLWRTMLHYTPCAIAYRVTKLAARTAADLFQKKTA